MRRICLVLILILLLSGCAAAENDPGITPPSRMDDTTVSVPPGPTPAPAGSEAETFTVVDDMGREVTVSKDPQRVVPMIGSFADIWCLAGGHDSIIATADDAWTSFDLELGEDVVNLGGVKDPVLEVLLAAEPDLVLASCNTTADLEMEDILEQANIPVIYFDVSDFHDYLRMLEICTRLTGHTENYISYGTDVAAQVNVAIARQDGSAPTVLFVRSSGSLCKIKSSKGNVLGEMLATMGCINVADNDKTLLEELSMEAIIAADPDYIFAVLQGEDQEGARALLEASLLSNPAWNNLTAVKEGRFYIMDQRLYHFKPNARWGEAYEQLADILYPAE